MNRIQNESVTSRCEDSGNSWDCVSVFSQMQKDGWIEIMDPPVYDDEDLNIFLQILPSKQTDGDGLTWPHLGRVNTREPEAITWLTRGSFVVKEIITWDSDTDLVYFMGTMDGRPTRRERPRVSRVTSRHHEESRVTVTVLISMLTINTTSTRVGVRDYLSHFSAESVTNLWSTCLRIMSSSRKSFQ